MHAAVAALLVVHTNLTGPVGSRWSPCSQQATDRLGSSLAASTMQAARAPKRKVPAGAGDQYSQWPEAVAESMQEQVQDYARQFGSVHMQKPISCVGGGDWRASFSHAYRRFEVGCMLQVA